MRTETGERVANDEPEATVAHLWATADLLTPMTVRVAATLRIADRLAAGPSNAEELARAVHADAGTLDRVLKHLARHDVLDRNDDGVYTLTSLGALLRDDHPSGLRQRLDLESAVGRADQSFVQLLRTVRTGDAAFPAQFDRSFWDDLATDPVRSASFDAQMSSDVTGWAPAIIAAYDWGSLRHVIDVGGGTGTLLVALLTAFPALRGTVLERPGPAEAARHALRSAGLSDRADVVAGSFFEPLPQGAGGYLLTAIVHDWDDQAARTILRRCRDAAGRHGRVLVIEKIGVDGASPSTEMDLRLLAYFGGRERDPEELVALAEQVGLRLDQRHPAGNIVIFELAAS